MDTEMKPTPEVLEAVKRIAADGHMSCPKARALAKELNVAPKVIGAACDELSIKLKDCQLGCF